MTFWTPVTQAFFFLPAGSNQQMPVALGVRQISELLTYRCVPRQNRPDTKVEQPRAFKYSGSSGVRYTYSTMLSRSIRSCGGCFLWWLFVVFGSLLQTRSLVAAPKPGDGPLMERRADRELPGRRPS